MAGYGQEAIFERSCIEHQGVVLLPGARMVEDFPAKLWVVTYADAGKPPSVSASPAFSAYGTLASSTIDSTALSYTYYVGSTASDAGSATQSWMPSNSPR